MTPELKEPKEKEEAKPEKAKASPKEETKAEISKPEEKKVLFRFVKAAYRYWIECPKPIAQGAGGPIYDQGLCVKAEKHRVELELPRDQKIYDALKSSDRYGIDFQEVGDVNGDLKRKGNVMQALNDMDVSQILMMFSNRELEQLGLTRQADKFELIAGFVELDKKLI